MRLRSKIRYVIEDSKYGICYGIPQGPFGDTEPLWEITYSTNNGHWNTMWFNSDGTSRYSDSRILRRAHWLEGKKFVFVLGWVDK